MLRTVKLEDWNAYRYFNDSQNPESVSNLSMGRIVSARDYIQVRFSFRLNEIVKEGGILLSSRAITPVFFFFFF